MDVNGTVQVVMEDLVKKERVIEETGFVVASTETANTVQNKRIARSLDLEMDEERGGFLVNSQLQAVDGVYVAGDCSSYYERVLKLRRRFVFFLPPPPLLLPFSLSPISLSHILSFIFFSLGRSASTTNLGMGFWQDTIWPTKNSTSPTKKETSWG